MEHEVLAPAQLTRLHGQTRCGKAPQERLDRDRDLDARERRAEAQVQLVAEREVRVRRPPHDEGVGIVEDALVVVRRSEQQLDHVVLLEHLPPKRRTARDPALDELQRALVAEHLLDRRRAARALVREARSIVGTLQELREPARDRARRGLVTRQQELDDGDDLRAHVAVGHRVDRRQLRHQVAQHVVGRVALAVVEEPAQPRRRLLDRGDGALAAAHQHGGDAPEHVAILARHAEQREHDGRRQRERERRDHVDVGLALDLVEQLVDRCLDGRREALEARLERPAPDLAVRDVLGRIAPEEAAEAGKRVPHDGRRLGLLDPRLAREAIRVLEHRLDVGVPAHEPRAEPIAPHDGRLVAQAAVDRVRARRQRSELEQVLDRPFGRRRCTRMRSHMAIVRRPGANAPTIVRGGPDGILIIQLLR